MSESPDTRLGLATTRVGLLLSILLLPMLGCWWAGSSAQTVVLISVDTLRADHLGLYGYERDTSPNLDHFFGSATVFENAVSSAPCTVPSVDQFLGGSFVKRIGQRSLAEILHEAGFATAAIVSQHQFRKGQTERYRAGFDHFDIQTAEEVDPHGMTTRRAEEVSDRALAWLDEHRDDAKKFLWLHYFDPHDPYDPPPGTPRFGDGISSKRSGDRRADLKRERKSPTEPWQRAGYIFSPEDVKHLIALYDAEIRYTDEQVGRVLRALESDGVLERSLVVLISDHGEWLGEEDRWDHCQTLREAEIRVPFLVRDHGGRLGTLGRETLAVSTLDVLPTILGSLGIAVPADLYDGEDLRSAPPGRAVASMWARSVVLRTQKWKLYHEEAPTALYRIGDDPDETTNLLGDRPGVRESLLRRMEPILALRRRVMKLNEEVVRRLRSMGYIE